MTYEETGGIRVYRITNPFHPVEPAGTRVLPGNVKRTVTFEGTTKVVTWDYTEAVF